MSDASSTALPDYLNVCFIASAEKNFPCNASAIVVVALSLGAGISALLMVLYLMRRVSVLSRSLLVRFLIIVIRS
jgi:hypothetical protein